MRAILEDKFFPHVIKPGRYAGGEPGQIVKDPSGRLKYLHAFPDKYELGQSYMGLQTLYHVINRDDRFLCERVFAVDLDAEEFLRREKLPLFSLESSRPAAEFDVIGFTLTYELVYTNVLAMLDLAGIPLRSRDRTDDQPLIMAGGPAVYNPEPLAEFIDLFFIGDAEEGLPEMLGLLHDLGPATRKEKLQLLAEKVESVYVPRFYDAEHNPLDPVAPPEIRARIVPELKPEYYPEQPIVPLVDVVHDHLGVEIMRGCPQGCRFCQAGPMYRPVRARSKDQILHQIETQIANSGYHQISLVSLSSSDYPEIEDLVRTATRRLNGQRVSMALPSLRPGSISPQLLDAAKLVRKSGLTLAPEAGTERLRLFIRKDFPDVAIYDTVHMAFEKGWKGIKLYFMVGLPTETDEDLLGIVNIIRNCYEVGRSFPGSRTMNITLSPFVPKPHTPFQWDAVVPPDEVLRRILLVKKKCRVRGVNFKYHSAEIATVTGLLGRGGREMADVIEQVYREGSRFDGWSETFQPDRWFAACRDNGIDIESQLRPIPFDRPLPWSHIKKGVSTEHLRKERERTSSQLKDYQPHSEAGDQVPPSDGPAMTFGRGTKKVPSRQTAAAPTKNRVRLRWSKTARYRYMSHLENMKLIERALRRARLPVAYSQGFNPSMKLSFGPPLPLGFTSEAEFVDVTLESNLMPHMVDALKATFPDGIDILNAAVVYGKSKSLSASLNRVVYTTALDKLDRRQVGEAIERVMAMDRIEVERTGKAGTKVVDVRPAIYDLSMDDDQLVMVLGLGEGGYVRATEVAMLLLENDRVQVAGLSFHRKDMYRQDSDERVSGAMDL